MLRMLGVHSGQTKRKVGQSKIWCSSISLSLTYTCLYLHMLKTRLLIAWACRSSALYIKLSPFYHPPNYLNMTPNVTKLMTKKYVSLFLTASLFHTEIPSRADNRFVALTGRPLYNSLVSDAERQCTGMSAFAERRWIRVSVSCQSISDIKRAAGTHLVSALTADPSISLWFSIVGRYGRVTARPVGWERPAYGRGHRHQASIYRIPHSGLHTVRCSAFFKILSFWWTKNFFLETRGPRH